MLRSIRCLALPVVLLALLLTATPARALGPTVVPTAEGQIGSTPDANDQLFGNRFESIRGQAGDVIFGGITIFGGPLPPPPGMQFLTDRLHTPVTPQAVAGFIGDFNAVDRVPPAIARSRNAANTDDFVVFSFAVDGAMPQTMTVRIASLDVTTGTPTNFPSITGLSSPVPDPSISQVGVAVDNQGRSTVVYTDVPVAGAADVKAMRYDADGNPIGGVIPVTDPGHAAADVALLDPAGNRLIVPTSDFAAIRGNIIDTSGPTPTVLPEFPISTTPAIFANLNTTVASDPASGVAMVAWENLSGLQGDPVNVFARRFDANGNPIGNDFMVNTTTANAQGQPHVAVGPNGIAAVAWAGDSGVLGDELDVFLQIYDADGNPLGGEIPVNTFTADVQDRPAVRFLPEPDTLGRPQVVVLWRDVGVADGSQPRGTGRSYRCFSIEGLEDPTAIFADGFETGDTTSWSDSQP